MKSTTPDAPVTSQLSAVSEKVLLNHLHSFGHNDLEKLMTDYTEQSMLITHDATYSGIDEIKAYFSELMDHFPKGQTNFELDKSVISDELVFITWHATTPTLEVLLATDTFVIKEGKIRHQTFAGQLKFQTRK